MHWTSFALDGQISRQRPSTFRGSTKMKPAVLSQAIRGLLLGTTAASCMAAPALSAAETTLEEVVVTATRRATSIQDVPIAISALTADALTQAGVNRVDDLASAVPNTFINTGGGLRTTSVTVRGISSNPNNPGVDPSVGVFVDGVYMSRPTTLNASLYDLERIEVVRGPQGALYGKNTIAGALNFISKLPTEEFTGEARLSYGNHADTSVFGVLSGALGSDRVLGRISGSFQQRDGLTKNLATGTQLDDIDSQSARATLLWKPMDTIDVIVRGDTSRDRTNAGSSEIYRNGAFEVTPLADASPWDRRVSNDRDTVQNRDTDGASLQIDVDAMDGVLTSISAYRQFDWHNVADNDFTVLNMLSSGIDENQSEWSQELRFVSGSDGPLQYVAGAFYSNQSLDTASVATVGPDLGIYPTEVQGVINADLTTESFAAYGQVAYDFAERWNATLALRYSNESKDVEHQQTGDPFQILLQDQPLQRLSRSDSELSPSASLTYEFSDVARAYASYGRGFKAGGYNVFSISMTDPAEYEPEVVDSYELGFKAMLADERVRLNAALFYMDYQDLQVNQLVLENGVPQFTTSNAASATSQGIEVELTAKVTDTLEGSLNYGYADATYDDFRNANLAGDDYSGNRLPEAAKHTVSAALDYHRLLGAALQFTARADVTYRSAAYFEPANVTDYEQGGYALLGARVGLASANGHWGVTAWGRNLADEDYVAFRGDGVIVPGQAIQTLGLPRTYGIELNVGF
jgi:iron complex outermembrane recepter protein